MKQVLLTLLAIFLVLPFAPWWIIWIIVGVYGWFAKYYKEAIGYGGGIVVVAWGIKLGIGYFTGGSILMGRVATMMHLESSSWLIIVSLLLAAIVGMFSSLSGCQLQRLYYSFFSISHSNKKYN